MLKTKPTLSTRTAAVILAVLCAVMFMPSMTFAASSGAMKISASKATIYIGKTKTIKVKGLKKAKLKKVKWKTSDKSIVKLSKKKGKKTVLKPVAIGKATVTAKYGKTKKKCKVTVKKAVTEPTISGTAAVGQTLTAKAEGTVNYQWFRYDGTDITLIRGAMSSTYTVQKKDIGYKLYVGIQGKGYYTEIAYSSYTDKVPDNTTPISITIGSKLTLSDDTPLAGDTINAYIDPLVATGDAVYTWYTVDLSTGAKTAIANQDHNYYIKITSDMAGKGIYCEATANNNYTGTAASETTKAVKVSVTGMAAATWDGTKLTCGATEPADATVKYQWHKMEDGTQPPDRMWDDKIDGATSATYTPTEAGSYFCEVIGTGNYSTEKAPYGTLIPESGTKAGTEVTGVAKATYDGTTLTCGAVTPASAAVTYQWYKEKDDGTINAFEDTEISGATSSTYTPKDKGVYWCAVKGAGLYYGTAIPTEGKIVYDMAIKGVAAPTWDGTKLTCGVIAPADATVTYKWRKEATPGQISDSDATIDGAVSATYTPTESGTYYCQVTGIYPYMGNNVTPSSGTAVTVAPSGTQVTKPTITVATDSNMLTAVIADGDTVSYQWKKGGVAIDGATDATYTPTEAGDYTVTITGTGNCTGTATSDATTMTAASGTLSYPPNPVVGSAPSGLIGTYKYSIKNEEEGYGHIGAVNADTGVITAVGEELYGSRITATGVGTTVGSRFCDVVW